MTPQAAPLGGLQGLMAEGSGAALGRGSACGRVGLQLSLSVHLSLNATSFSDSPELLGPGRR